MENMKRDLHAAVICNLGVLLLVGVLLGCSQAPSKSESQTAVQQKVTDLPIPPEFKDSTDKEFLLGGLLKDYDDVAWLATDALRAVGYKDDPAKPVTYVVEPTSDDLHGVFRATFIALNSAGKPEVIGVAEVKHDSGMGHVTGAQMVVPPIPPSDPQALLYSAVIAAAKAPGLQLCNAHYNHVVVPYMDNGKVEYRVYFLMSSDKQGEVPVGGHVLVRVSEDGKTILEVKPLAKSCMMAEGTDQQQVAALGFTDLALDSPSAAQVFLMWRYQKPVYMGTENGFLWAIDSQGIRLLKDGQSPK